MVQIFDAPPEARSGLRVAMEGMASGLESGLAEQKLKKTQSAQTRALAKQLFPDRANDEEFLASLEGVTPDQLQKVAAHDVEIRKINASLNKGIIGQDFAKSYEAQTGISANQFVGRTTAEANSLINTWKSNKEAEALRDKEAQKSAVRLTEDYIKEGWDEGEKAQKALRGIASARAVLSKTETGLLSGKYLRSLLASSTGIEGFKSDEQIQLDQATSQLMGQYASLFPRLTEREFDYINKTWMPGIGKSNKANEGILLMQEATADIQAEKKRLIDEAFKKYGNTSDPRIRSEVNEKLEGKSQEWTDKIKSNILGDIASDQRESDFVKKGNYEISPGNILVEDNQTGQIGQIPIDVYKENEEMFTIKQ